ncbi:transporter substrate-binding domain-containing protein [Labrenzia sp. PHM005]|uniref:transporter substrate-binding domain-containing protein n=1 Tax=Labrenzia sp. PHM005 TaxID=2590016 RepID=UPI0011405321|nr:transporter substrate-binding domain-containing protein [Labrenzia sp. PHM005]QDG78236.1 transporter substrate-binding domain-containing protein [Labrenzia sp. PHM005]
MYTNKSKLLTAVAVGLLSVNVFSLPVKAAGITIIATEIEGLHQGDGKGFYDEVLTSMTSSFPVALKVLPPNRAAIEFERCENCCLSPANKNTDFYDYPADYLVTTAMTEAKVYIWTAPGSAPVNSLSDLAGKKVGARHGMTYGNAVESAGIKFDLASTINQSIKKLEVGRLDAFIAYVLDAYTTFEEMGKEPFPHDKANPVAVHDDSVLCKPTSETEVFVREFNAHLANME